MGQWTNFPNGISLTTTTGTVAGQLNATTGAFANLVTVGTLSASGVVIGETAFLKHTFGAASTAETAYLTIPFSGNIVSAFMTIGATSAVAAAYTVRIGSAGTVAVASVANTNTLNGSQQALTTTTIAVTTAAGITVVRAAQGTTGATEIGVLIKRTG